MRFAGVCGWGIDYLIALKAILEDETAGFVRIHVRQKSDRIVGATIVGANAGEMIGEISLATTKGIGLGSIANAAHIFSLDT